jgi:hypothetical protein
VRSRAIYLSVGVAVLASGAVLLLMQSHLTFFLDDWDLLANRQAGSVGDFLDPHAEHIVLAPYSIYRLLLAVFGMDSSFPFSVVSTSMLLAAAVLLFAYIRRRTDPLIALVGAVLVLFLGSCWRDLLWPFQIAYSGSLAAGLGMLLVLDRNDSTGDRLACALLFVSMTFSSLGVPFAAGALVEVLTNPRARPRRLWIPLVPAALFGVWWLGWGHEATSYISLDNVLDSPSWVFDAISQGAAGLTGFSLSDIPMMPEGLGWGRAIVVVGALVSVWRLRRVGVSRTLWVALAVGAGFWFLAAFNANPFRAPTSLRYIYPSAVLVLVIAAELLRGVRLGRPAAFAVCLLAAAALASNIVMLSRGYDQFRNESTLARSDLAVLDIARPAVTPGFALSIANRGPLWLQSLEAESYYRARDKWGTPAFSEAELASQRVDYRSGSDSLLTLAEGIQLASGGSVSRGDCRTLSPAAGSGSVISLDPGEITLLGSGGKPTPATVPVDVGRFADGEPLELGELLPHRPQTLAIPADASRRAWRLALGGVTQRVILCSQPVTSLAPAG